MSYGWCRPCTSWGINDGESLEGIAGTADDYSRLHGALTPADSYAIRGDAVLSSISNDIESDDDMPNNQNDTLFKIVDGDNPYKIEYFERQLFQQEPSESRKNVVLNTLRELGVKPFIVDEMAVKNSSDILFHVNHIIKSIEQESIALVASSTLGPQRCLLFQDQQRRLFNLVLSSNNEGPKRRWEEHLESFSTIRAMSAFTLLLRSFPGIFLEGQAQNHRPLLLAIIIGLILTDEISLTGSNMGLLVRNIPSHCALSLRAVMHDDAFRKASILFLVLGASTVGWAQTVFTSTGLILACLLLIINLGARSWYFSRMTSFKRDRIGGSIIMPFLVSLFTGIFAPFLSSRISASGGKRAVERIIFSAVCLAFVIVGSDLQGVQKFIVVNTEVYDQTMINFILGSWWTISSLGSLCFAMRKQSKQDIPDGEHFLIRDGSSPVGFRVPSLPRYEVDEKLALKRRHQTASTQADFISAVLVVISIATVMAVTSFTKKGDSVV